MARKKLSITAKDTYDSFPNKETISYEAYIKIIRLFFVLMFKFMLENSKIFRFPKSIGYFGMRKAKMTNRKTIDLNHYRLTGEKVRKKLNMDGTGHYAILKWWNAKNVCSVRKRRVFKFKASKQTERTIREYIRSNNILHTYYYTI